MVFSGIQPSGSLHIGNYLGAIKRWVEEQDRGKNIFCVVDLHAITVAQDSRVLREKTLDTVALLLAAGIDPEKSLLFVQSQNPDHAYLGWILNCFTSMGQMNRMTQYKEKAEGKEFVSVGLFDYPVLMAADILLYGTTDVPVGEDQKQHVELARDLAERFNAKYGSTFVLPEARIAQTVARVMSLQDPHKKMSKSDTDPMGAIGLLDDENLIKKKVASAVTDSLREVRCDPGRPGVFNLIAIYSQLAGIKPQEVEVKYSGMGYSEFKADLAELVLSTLRPLQKRYMEIRPSGELEKVMSSSAEQAREISRKRLAEVKERVGLING